MDEQISRVREEAQAAEARAAEAWVAAAPSLEVAIDNQTTPGFTREAVANMESAMRSHALQNTPIGTVIVTFISKRALEIAKDHLDSITTTIMGTTTSVEIRFINEATMQGDSLR